MKQTSETMQQILKQSIFTAQIIFFLNKKINGTKIRNFLIFASKAKIDIQNKN